MTHSICEFNFSQNKVNINTTNTLQKPFQSKISKAYKSKVINGLKERKDFITDSYALSYQLEKEDLQFIKWLIDTSILIENKDIGMASVLLRNNRHIEFFTQFLGNTLLKNKNSNTKTQEVYLELLSNINSNFVKDYFYVFIEKVKDKKLKSLAKYKLRRFYLQYPQYYSTNEPLRLLDK